MRRGGGRSFNKIIHHYEPYIDGKRHKVGIKIDVTKDGEKVQYFTEHIKDLDTKKPIIERFDTLPKLYNWIEEQLIHKPEVTWERKIYVHVRGYTFARRKTQANYKGESLLHASIDIEAEAIEIGTAPDGRKWRRAPDNPKSAEKFDENIGYGLEHSWSSKREGTDPDDPYSRALIDDTPENRELLVAFSVKFDGLRDQFFRAFAPEHVHQFLNHAAGTLLLNAPNEVAE